MQANGSARIRMGATDVISTVKVFHGSRCLIFLVVVVVRFFFFFVIIINKDTYLHQAFSSHKKKCFVNTCNVVY